MITPFWLPGTRRNAVGVISLKGKGRLDILDGR